MNIGKNIYTISFRPNSQNFHEDPAVDFSFFGISGFLNLLFVSAIIYVFTGYKWAGKSHVWHNIGIGKSKIISNTTEPAAFSVVSFLYHFFLHFIVTVCWVGISFKKLPPGLGILRLFSPAQFLPRYLEKIRSGPR